MDKWPIPTYIKPHTHWKLTPGSRGMVWTQQINFKMKIWSKGDCLLTLQMAGNWEDAQGLKEWKNKGTQEGNSRENLEGREEGGVRVLYKLTLCVTREYIQRYAVTFSDCPIILHIQTDRSLIPTKESWSLHSSLVPFYVRGINSLFIKWVLTNLMMPPSHLTLAQPKSWF